MATRLDTEEAARSAATELMRKGRRRPAVVVTSAQGQPEPYVDVEEIQSAVDGLCDVFVLPTGAQSWAFSKELPDGRQVYGGASRVYSTDLAWMQDQSRSPLRFAYGPGDRTRVTHQLISDALAAVQSGGRWSGSSTPAGGSQCEGTVTGVSAGRALVELDKGGRALPATVRPELLVPGVAAERLFAKGQRVRGLYYEEANRLEVSRDSQLPADEAFATVARNDVLLGRVAKVGTKYLTLTILPGVDLRTSAEDLTEDGDELANLVSVGEVLPFEVVELTNGVPSAITLLTPDFVELAKPVSVLRDGPTWLVPRAPEMGASSNSDGPSEATIPLYRDIDGTDPTVAALIAENVDLRRRVQRAEGELTHLRDQLADARTSARTAKQRARQATKGPADDRSERARASPGRFSDPADQFHYEVYVSWAERTTPDDKKRFPWREFTIGQRFLATLTVVEGIDRAKVAEVVADVVSGRADTMEARGLHPLRQGSGGSDPEIIREDGALCWRAYLQNKSASARRLHFWRLPGGCIELSSVRLHDDMRP